uniref:NADH-ubiquinone oxidoreductase chain 2 n=1 Tax=Botryllus schlosseri TaxID=30301 RepID=S0DFD0_BOTSH|nr:NADH dehydrogenase subunit 2 [Botryllus schlosseri]CCO25684.1 NADH dehydrogenase subunit 2 [Botryllus schlosseri]CDM98964.1 NADH dehydrogenase subunit 2 [Botryllus schlosseri]
MYLLGGLMILFFLAIIMGGMFYMWILLEMVFFFVIFYLIVTCYKKLNLNSIVYYLFIQALGGIMLMSSFLIEMFYFGNLYFFNSGMSWICFFLGLMSLLIKMGVFPFYLQIYKIMSFMNFKQIFMFMVYPKVVPMVMLYNLIGGVEFELNGILIMPFLLLLISGFQGIYSSDIREILAWSGMSQLSWIFVGILGNFFFFLSFFILYSVLLYYICFMVFGSGSKIYYDYMLIGGGYFGNFVMMLLVFLMSGLAPFLMFYMKLFLIFEIMNYSILFLFLMLLGSLGIFFFYVRVIQMGLSLGGSFYYFTSNNYIFKPNYVLFFNLFLFSLGGILILV